MISPRDILNGKILIVDDQEANVLLLERMLRGAGYVSITSTMDAECGAISVHIGSYPGRPAKSSFVQRSTAVAMPCAHTTANDATTKSDAWQGSHPVLASNER